MRTLRAIDLGTVPYEDAYFLQKEIVRGIRTEGCDDCLLLAEHPGIFTIGRSGSRKNLLADEDYIKRRGLGIIDVDRGGDITFHGTGQLVAYPIFNLNRHVKNIRLFLRSLERTAELTVSEYGLAADGENKYTGLWVHGRKICFIGIGISSWITYHGLSINANVDLEYYTMIRPCGIEGLKVGSLNMLLNEHVDFELLKDVFLKKCCEVFDFERVYRNPRSAILAEKAAS